MKHIIYLFILTIQIGWAQEVKVTDNKGTIHKIRNNQVTTSNNKPSATDSLEGDVWFNNTDPNSITTNIYDGNYWKEIRTEPKSKSVILNKEGGTITGTWETYMNMPLNINDVTYINNTYYKVNNTMGQITVLESGNYLISGELSIKTMPGRSTKYILAFYVNNVLKGYLSRGYASLPNENYWGTSGIIMYPLNKNDKIRIKYIINKKNNNWNTPNVSHPAIFLNIGVTKI